MRRNIGRMRHRVTIAKPVRVGDGALGYSRSDGDIAQTWARIAEVTGGETYRYGHLEQQLSHTIVIRYDSRVEQGMLIKYQNRHFYILAVTDKNERKEFMTLVCREGGND